jgi:adenosylcobinamide-GDP ribazoletransferase
MQQASMWLALSFLTTLPVPAGVAGLGEPGGARQALGRAAGWFPVVGLVLGLMLAVTHWLLARLFEPLLAAALVVAIWAALTGGLHLDGLADCGDGLLAATTRERRLEIMRDPRLGTFGGLSLLLFVMLKVLAVGGLPAGGLSGFVPVPLAGGAALLPFVIAPVTGRWLLLLAGRQPAARPDGLGAAFASGLRPGALWLAAGLTLAMAALGGARGLAALAVAHLVAAAVFGLARARLGGLTGDVFGLTVELAELAVLLAFAARPVL